MPREPDNWQPYDFWRTAYDRLRRRHDLPPRGTYDATLSNDTKRLLDEEVKSG